MSASTVFRMSVVLSPLLAIAGVLYFLTTSPHLSTEWQTLLEWSGDGAMIFLNEVPENPSPIDITIASAFALILIAIVINQIALFFYRSWARTVYLWANIAGFALTPFLGLSIALPLETLFTEMSIFVSGITLALAYFSPVAEKFRRPRQLAGI